MILLAWTAWNEGHVRWADLLIGLGAGGVTGGVIANVSQVSQPPGRL